MLLGCSGRCDPLAADRSFTTPDPPSDTDRRYAHRTPSYPPRHAGRLPFALKQLTIRVRRLVGRDRPWMRAPLRCRHPATDVRERLRTTDRACLLVVNFFAIETEAGNVKLHPSSYQPTKPGWPEFTRFWDKATFDRVVRAIASGRSRGHPDAPVSAAAAVVGHTCSLRIPCKLFGRGVVDNPSHVSRLEIQ